ARPLSCRNFRLLRRLRDGKADRKDSASPVGAVRRHYRALQGLGEATRDCQTQASTRAHLVALPRAIEFVEDALQVGGWNAIAFVSNLQLDGILVTPTLNADGGVRRRVLCSIVQEIEEDLLEQDGIHRYHRQVRAQLHVD